MSDSRLASPSQAAARALGVAALVTAIAALVVRVAPIGWRGTAVGAVFLAATYICVWRLDDGSVARAGLGFGGLIADDDPEPTGMPWLAPTMRALSWSLAACLLTFVPFYFGWRDAWHVPPTRHFAWPAFAWIARIAAGQLIGVALPEEAFYRGYLQSRLNDAFEPVPGEPAKRVLGVSGRSWLAIAVTSAVFALGHVATLPYVSRLAVFFPSLAFGFLRKRTGGIGASMVFHAACNTLSETLGAGYGLY